MAEWERARELGTTLFVESMIEGEPPVEMPWDPAAYGVEPNSRRAEAGAEAETEAEAAAVAVAGSSRDGEISLDLLTAYAFGGDKAN